MILSTAYLPPIQFFKLIAKSDIVLLEKHETYPKQTYRNRCEIYTTNGLLALTIPVIKPNGNRTKILDIKIDNSVKWRKEHWRAIESAYQNSAFFEFVKDYFIPFYENEWNFIWDYNISIINTLLEILEIDISIKETDRFIKEYPENFGDYRCSISPKNRNKNYLQNPYFQVFASKHGFIPNLSIIDLLCNCGMDSLAVIGIE